MSDLLTGITGISGGEIRLISTPDGKMCITTAEMLSIILRLLCRTIIDFRHLNINIAQLKTWINKTIEQLYPFATKETALNVEYLRYVLECMTYFYQSYKQISLLEMLETYDLRLTKEVVDFTGCQELLPTLESIYQDYIEEGNTFEPDSTYNAFLVGFQSSFPYAALLAHNQTKCADDYCSLDLILNSSIKCLPKRCDRLMTSKFVNSVRNRFRLVRKVEAPHGKVDMSSEGAANQINNMVHLSNKIETTNLMAPSRSEDVVDSKLDEIEQLNGETGELCDSECQTIDASIPEEVRLMMDRIGSEVRAEMQKEILSMKDDTNKRCMRMEKEMDRVMEENKKMQTLKKNRDDLEKRLWKARDELKYTKEDNEDLKKKLKESQTLITKNAKKHEDEKSRLKKKMDNMQRNMDITKDENKRLGKSLDNLKKDDMELRKSYDELKKNNRELLEQITDHNDQPSTSNSSDRDDIQNFQAIIGEGESKLAKAKLELDLFLKNSSNMVDRTRAIAEERMFSLDAVHLIKKAKENVAILESNPTAESYLLHKLTTFPDVFSKVTVGKMKENDEIDRECYICDDEKTQEMMKCKKCSKMCHMKCYKEWEKISPTCPMCRESFPDEEFPSLSQPAKAVS